MRDVNINDMNLLSKKVVSGDGFCNLCTWKVVLGNGLCILYVNSCFREWRVYFVCKELFQVMACGLHVHGKLFQGMACALHVFEIFFRGLGGGGGGGACVLCVWSLVELLIVL